MSEEKTELQRSLEEYEIRKEKALGMGGPKKLAKRKEEGQLNARERIDCLVDDDSFVESGLFGTSAFAKDADNTPGDGKLVGYAKIDGRDVGVVVNDFTVKGASTSSTNSKKVGWIRRTGTERGLPVIFIGESTGARLPDAMGSKGMGTMLGNDIHQFQRTRVTPWVAAALGNSFGSSAWLACCSDFVVMRKGSIMAVSSPKLVSEALKREVDLEELGGWKLHAETTGLIDRAVDTDEEAMEEIQTFLSYLPSHHKEAPPVVPVTPGSGEDIADIGDILPERRTQVYDVRKVLKKVVDKGSYFELKARYGKPAVTALCRLDGKSVGIIANNPKFKGGSMDVNAIKKMVSFTVMCDSFNIPIVKIVDTPGFMIGLDAEREGAPGKIMNFMNATTLITVPTITVILRKSYGRAYVTMGGGRHSDDICAWPTAEVSFMDPVAATKIVHNKKPGDEGFEEALAQINQDNDVWGLASVYSVQAVIRPEETRNHLIRMLDVHRLRLTNGVGEHMMRTWPTSY